MYDIVNSQLPAIPPRIRGIRHHRYDTYYRQNFPQSCNVLGGSFVFYLIVLSGLCAIAVVSVWIANDRIIDTEKVVVNIEKTFVSA